MLMASQLARGKPSTPSVSPLREGILASLLTRCFPIGDTAVTANSSATDYGTYDEESALASEMAGAATVKKTAAMKGKKKLNIKGAAAEHASRGANTTSMEKGKAKAKSIETGASEVLDIDSSADEKDEIEDPDDETTTATASTSRPTNISKGKGSGDTSDSHHANAITVAKAHVAKPAVETKKRPSISITQDLAFDAPLGGVSCTDF